MPVSPKNKQPETVTVYYIGGCDGVIGRFPSGALFECNRNEAMEVSREDFESLPASEWSTTKPAEIISADSGDTKEN